jgi:hypothetical protein
MARWRQGELLRLIARRLGKRGPSMRAFVLQTGRVQRHPPRRAPGCLSMAECEESARCGRWRAVPADRGPAGAGTVDGVAGAGQQRRPWPVSGPGRRRRCLPAGAGPKPAKLVTELRLRAVVESKLAVRWSPADRRVAL